MSSYVAEGDHDIIITVRHRDLPVDGSRALAVAVEVVDAEAVAAAEGAAPAAVVTLGSPSQSQP